MVTVFPLFFARYWARELPGATSTQYLAYGNSAAGFIVMVLAPWLGALADRTGTKKRWLGIYTAVGVLATLGLAGVGAGQWLPAITLFVLACVGFSGGSSFQDALIVEVTEPHESDRVSSLGYALGYLGGGLAFLICVVLLSKPHWFGLADVTAATRATFVLVALWWVVFSLPLFCRVPDAPPAAEAAGWRELYATLRQVLRNRPVMEFLIAYWLYIDAIGTLQLMAVDFGAKIGLSTPALMGSLLMVQFVSFPAAIAFGRLAGRIGTLASIRVGLVVFSAVALWAYSLDSDVQFFSMAFIVSLVQGGIQALSRSHFSRVIPREKSGEYFGFYNMIGKFAAVLGPLVVGAVVWFTHDPRLSIPVLAVFFITGLVLLGRVCDPSRRA
jgi:UMF1 family MFS transporter